MNKILIILLCFLIVPAQGQIFNKEQVLPGVRSIQTKFYGGTGGRGYWNIKYYDQLGRLIREQSCKRHRLMGEYGYKYDQYNNEIMFVCLFDINHPDRTDTVSFSRYEYDATGEIIKEYTSLSDVKRTIEMTSRNDDLVFYRQINETFLQEEDTGISDTLILAITYSKDGQIERKEIENLTDHAINIYKYSYNTNGHLQRTRINRSKESVLLPIYIGGPGGDDVVNDYKYNKEGDVKVAYVVIDGRRLKFARYRYRYW